MTLPLECLNDNSQVFDRGNFQGTSMKRTIYLLLVMLLQYGTAWGATNYTISLNNPMYDDTSAYCGANNCWNEFSSTNL